MTRLEQIKDFLSAASWRTPGNPINPTLDDLEWAVEEIERLRAIVAPIEELTAGGAASVLLYEVAGVEASEKFTVAVNECLPPLFEYFDGATYAEALAKAVESRRTRGSE